jgi:aminopeptidase N
MKKLSLFFSLILFSALVFGQGLQHKQGAEWCSYKKSHTVGRHTNVLKNINYPAHQFDVLNYKLSFDLYNCFYAPFPHDYTAKNIIRIRIDSTLSSIQLDADDSSLMITSVENSGFSFSHNNNILTINLDRVYHPGEILEIGIIFRHYNIEDGGFYARDGFVFTDAEPEGARLWFPCWDRPSDKATLDLTARVPGDVLLGSNGRLADSLKTGDTIYYHWISRDPIATYLMAMTSKRGYHLKIRNWKNHEDGSLTPIRYYYNDGENSQLVQSIIDTVADYFQNLFGAHPFEKNGFATLNDEFTWGGMENQTLTSLCSDCWDPYTAVHEFAHQWFGDMITCSTWADLWLNEGFASYMEAIIDGWYSGPDAYMNHIKDNARKYREHNPGWAVSPDSWAVQVPSNDTLFSYYITYMKGSCVLHMLRYTIGDSLFFKTLHSYATDTNFRFKSVQISDFVNKVNSVTGENCNWFFNEWLKQPNHPVYNNSYCITDYGNNSWQIDFTAKQIQTNAPFFTMPIELKIRFSDNSDTLFRVINYMNNQVFNLHLNKQPVSLTFDPDSNIVLKEGYTLLDITNRNRDMVNSLWVSPNPVKDHAEISFILSENGFTQLSILDITGKEIRALKNEYATKGKYLIPLEKENLCRGIYFLRMKTGTYSKTVKIIIAGE